MVVFKVKIQSIWINYTEIQLLLFIKTIFFLDMFALKAYSPNTSQVLCNKGKSIFIKHNVKNKQ